MKILLEPGTSFSLLARTFSIWTLNGVNCNMTLDRETEVYFFGAQDDYYHFLVCSGKFSGYIVKVKPENLITEDTFINQMDFVKKRKYNSQLNKFFK